MGGCGAGVEGDWVDDGAATGAAAVEVGMERGDFAEE